jgi:hypothetical protein
MSHIYLVLGIALFPALAVFALILSLAAYIQRERTRRHNNRGFRELQLAVAHMFNRTDNPLYQAERKPSATAAWLYPQTIRPQVTRSASQHPLRLKLVLYALTSDPLSPDHYGERKRFNTL